MNLTSPESMNRRMFSIRPLVRLSTTRTDAPRASSASTRCDPMNEAPPVTSTVRLCQCMCRHRLFDMYVRFDQHALTQNQHVHPRSQEAVERFGRAQNNGLVLVER